MGCGGGAGRNKSQCEAQLVKDGLCDYCVKTFLHAEIMYRWTAGLLCFFCNLGLFLL